jgi:hypothetical protein
MQPASRVSPDSCIGRTLRRDHYFFLQIIKAVVLYTVWHELHIFRGGRVVRAIRRGDSAAVHLLRGDFGALRRRQCSGHVGRARQSANATERYKLATGQPGARRRRDRPFRGALPVPGRPLVRTINKSPPREL